MFLKRLYIHNYKSFYHTEIELDKLNIFVGENNVGKSNLIDVLEFLNIAMSKNIQRAINDKGGYKNIKNYNYPNKKVVIRATFDSEDTSPTLMLLGQVYLGIIQVNGEYTISISFDEDNIFLSVQANLNVAGSKKLTNSDIVAFQDGKFDYKNKMEIENVAFVISNRIGLKYGEVESKFFKSKKCNKDFVDKHIFGILHKLNLSLSKDYNLEFNTFKELFGSYYFDTNEIKRKSNNETEPILKKDGSNLGSVLYNQLKTFAEFDIVSNSLIGIVKEIDSIDVQEIAGSYIIIFKEKNGVINIQKVSDGTIMLLSTMTALNQPNSSYKLLAFEEPERHLHLKAIDYLLDAFRNSDKQIIVTTHSTEMLKCANLDEVIFLYRDSDGDTQAVRADEIEGLKDKLKNLAYERDLTLDELISDGIIGDFE